MARDPDRTLAVAHASPGRLRLRLPWLAAHSAEATALADRLAEEPGVEEVEVRPRTGSVLLHFDEERTDADRLAERAAVLADAERVAEPTEDLAAYRARARAAAREGSDLARAFAAFVKGVNADVLTWTRGEADLPLMAATGLLVASAAEVVTSGELPVPAWYQLAWWALRTFALFEQPAIERTRSPLEELH
jgi:hypothetical protein